MAVFTFSPFGYDGDLVAVEVELRKGLPAVDVTGMADGSIKESRERIENAIINSGFEFLGGLEEESDEGISFCKDYEKTIRCSRKVRDALVVAAADRHNILLYGSPGYGRSLLLRKFRHIVPNLAKEERKAVERIYSIAGLYINCGNVVE